MLANVNVPSVCTEADVSDDDDGAAPSTRPDDAYAPTDVPTGKMSLTLNVTEVAIRSSLSRGRQLRLRSLLLLKFRVALRRLHRPRDHRRRNTPRLKVVQRLLEHRTHIRPLRRLTHKSMRVLNTDQLQRVQVQLDRVDVRVPANNVLRVCARCCWLTGLSLASCPPSGTTANSPESSAGPRTACAHLRSGSPDLRKVRLANRTAKDVALIHLNPLTARRDHNLRRQPSRLQRDPLRSRLLHQLRTRSR
jgi:hypothetical protein